MTLSILHSPNYTAILVTYPPTGPQPISVSFELVNKLHITLYSSYSPSRSCPHAAGLSDKYRIIVIGKYLLKSKDRLLRRSLIRGDWEFIKWYEVYLAGYPFQEI